MAVFTEERLPVGVRVRILLRPPLGLAYSPGSKAISTPVSIAVLNCSLTSRAARRQPKVSMEAIFQVPSWCTASTANMAAA